MTSLQRVASVCAIWIAMMGAEIVHGALREAFLAPSLGNVRARQVSVLTGSLLILTIAWLAHPRLHTGTVSDLVLVGAVWVMLTLAFELILGRFVLGFSWERIASDYALTRGGLLPLGLVVMLFSPLIAQRLRRGN